MCDVVNKPCAEFRHFPVGDRPVAALPVPPMAIHRAADAGDAYALRAALASDCLLDTPTWFGLTALHLCARRYGQARAHWRDTQAARYDRVCALLLAAGADPTLRDFAGQMPAAWAEGFLPPSLRRAMLALAEAGTWREPLAGGGAAGDGADPTEHRRTRRGCLRRICAPRRPEAAAMDGVQ